ncbi:hypothetical protein IFR04_002565 [Cadophora malorum]|uniref:Uncharacterized protein n=1 Tax=Cadophora malorum TaxID=108018 RepID=A0A8H7WGE0_9HELO|nr:hypothetical protein IFR04_002565 [Cadophora malorum]
MKPDRNKEVPFQGLCTRAAKVVKSALKKIRNKIQPPSPAEIAAKDERRARRKRCQQWVESGGYVAGDVVGDSQDIEDVSEQIKEIEARCRWTKDFQYT